MLCHFAVQICLIADLLQVDLYKGSPADTVITSSIRADIGRQGNRDIFWAGKQIFVGEASAVCARGMRNRCHRARHTGHVKLTNVRLFLYHVPGVEAAATAQRSRQTRSGRDSIGSPASLSCASA